ncbi:MAG: choice-of-anchor D domain-containing protein [Ignavibacteriae bacterium]|nr:choice-of-anchor D domain-containing protein [Ignavibacteriota bacterium]
MTSIDYSVAYVSNPASPDIYCSGFRSGYFQFYPSLSKLQLFTNDAVNDIEWSPDGKFIAVALNSGKLAIVDVAAQAVVRSLDTIHTSAVSIRWDGYSSRVIASYINNIALIWDIGKHIFQQDVSDNVWEIASPIIASIKDINMGSVRVNGSLDSVVQSVLCLSQNPLSSSRIDAAEILNDADGAFRVISGVPADFSNALRSCLPIELQFTPKKAGIVTATLRLNSNMQIFDIALTGNGFDLDFTYPELAIDFGKVPVGLSKDSVLSPYITNTINKYLDIFSTSINGPDSKQFYIIAGDTAVQLNYKDSSQLQLRFAPRTIGRTSSSIKIDFNREDASSTSGSPVYVTLFGEGLCGNDSNRTLNVGLGNTIPAKVGTIVKIPIIMKLRPEQSREIIGPYFFCVLSFDATMLKPDPSLPQGTIIGNRRIMRMPGARMPDSDTLIMLPFLTLLGNDSIVTVHIDSIYLDDGGCPMTFKSDSVTIILTDLCIANGSTRLLAGSPITKMVVLPNPTTDMVKIQLTLSEESPIAITVHDALGREFIVHNTSILERGNHEATFDCSLLPSGIYSLILTTRSEVKLLQFVKQ